MLTGFVRRPGYFCGAVNAEKVNSASFMLRCVCELPSINTCVAEGAVFVIPSKLFSLKEISRQWRILVRDQILDLPIHKLQLRPVRMGVNPHLNIDLRKRLHDLVLVQRECPIEGEVLSYSQG